MKNSYTLMMRLLVLGTSLLAVRTAAAAAEATLKIDPSSVVQERKLPDLLGVNAALWHRPHDLESPEILGWLKAMHPGLIRLPGGSWSDEIYWNGNGVREGDRIDASKFKDGYWEVDYSGYAPGFRMDGKTRQPLDYHGHSDVRSLHQWIKSLGAQALVTVNAGTGTAQMAAEWVRWAKAEDFPVEYWEVGNELNGEWEAGHILLDGRKMNGEIYAARFLEFAKAMKEVDPSIKVGGPASSSAQLAFMEELLRDAGSEVDFISYHTYPVERTSQGEADVFAAADIKPTIERIRGLIRQYQPAREKEIPIGISEWNVGVVEDALSTNLLSGLWTCLFIGHMYAAGVDFANQWDLFSTTEKGGHGLFMKQGDGWIPRAQYWAMLLWGSHMAGDRMVEATLEGAPDVEVFATTGAKGLSVMLVNKSRSEPASVKLDIAGRSAPSAALRSVFSHREYVWDANVHQPIWSRPPSETATTFDGPPVLEVPPFSAVVYEFAEGSAAARKPAEVAAAGEPRLEISMPSSTAVDIPVECWILVRDGDTGEPFAGSLPEAELTIEGPGTLDSAKIRIAEAAGRFFVSPTGPGEIVVSAKAGDLTARGVLQAKKVSESQQTVWMFDQGIPAEGMKSSYALQAVDVIKPNKTVAEIDFKGGVAGKGKDRILEIRAIPEDFPKRLVGGVFADIKGSDDLACADPEARVTVILQSEADHWIPLGSTKLSELKDNWVTITERISEPEQLGAMDKLYSVIFQLNANKPVTGRIFFDGIGFLMRGQD